MKKFILFVAAVFVVSRLWADFYVISPSGHNLHYYVTNGTNVAVAKEIGTISGSLIIPDTVSYNGIVYTVTSIAEYAFYGCSGLTSVTMPNSITSIEGSAFINCSGLTSITIPSTVTSIGSYAFLGCSGLTSLTIPSTVTSIGNYAFDGCSGLTSVTIPTSVTSIGYSAFSGCSGLTSLTIPSSLTSIGAFAFANCAALEEVSWYANNSISYNNFFSGDTSLRVFNLGTNWSTFGTGTTWSVLGSRFISNLYALEEINTLAGCTDAVSVNGVLYSTNHKKLLSVPPAKRGRLTIDAQVIEIDGYAFDHCLVDTIDYRASNCTISISNSSTIVFAPGCQTRVLLIGEDVDVLPQRLLELPELQRIDVNDDNWNFFSADGMLVDEAGHTILRCPRGREGALVFPSGISRVAASAFTQCRKITSIDLSPISFIGEKAFEKCTGLRSLTIPASVDTISKQAFTGNVLDTLYYNATHAYTGAIISSYYSVFKSDSLRIALVGNGVEELPGGLLSRCKNLQGVSLPAGLTTIGDAVFDGCTLLSSIELPSSLTTIGEGAFASCTSLDTIIFPDSLQVIGESAFNGCASLTEITIPSSVTSIGDYAFEGCTSLNRMYYNAVRCASSMTTYSNGATAYSSGVSPKIFGYASNVAHVGHLIVGEGVRRMAPIWMYGVDTLTIPSTLDTLIMPNSSMQNNLRMVYFNSRQLHTVYDYKSDSIRVLSIFGRSGNLRHVVFGDSVEVLPSYCFAGCSQVREFVDLVLPSSVKELGSGAFEGCNQIKTAVIPDGLVKVGTSPFFGCKQLKKVTYNAIETEYYDDVRLVDLNPVPSVVTYSGMSVAYPQRPLPALADKLPPLDTIIIGPGVRNIAPCFFGFPWKTKLDTVSVARQTYVDNQSPTLTSIGNGAFANLNLVNAQSLFTDSLQYIDQAAFMKCTGVESVRLSDWCRFIGASAFQECRDLDSVWLPAGLQWIGANVFRGDSLLSYLYYDCDSLCIEHIYPDVCVPFANTVSLRGIDFGPHVRYINEGMFANAEGLERLELPEGLLGIGDYCFMMKGSRSTQTCPVTQGGYNKSLVDTIRLSFISLPSTIQSVGYKAFAQEVRCGNSPYHYIDTIVCRGAVPATTGGLQCNPYIVDTVWYIGGEVFEDRVYDSAILIVPCGAGETYANYSQQKPVGDPSGGSYRYRGATYYYDFMLEDEHPVWGDFQHIVEQMPFDVQLTVNVDSMGTASAACSGTNQGNLTGITLSACRPPPLCELERR